MTKETEEDKTGYPVLQEELERRYGPAMAQEIVDQIKKAEKTDHQPDYMAVKAVSEAVELFRNEAQQAIHRIKARKTVANDDITNLGEKRAWKDLEKFFGLYVTMHCIYSRMYRKAIAPYVGKRADWTKYKISP